MAIELDTILNQLEEDMDNKIATTNGYKTDPKIVRGIFTPPELGGYYPVVGFTLIRERITLSMSAGNVQEYARVLIYGYDKIAGLDKVENKGRNNRRIHELCHDVLKFVFTDDWTYTGSTNPASEIEYYEGSIQDPVSVFVFQIDIHYDATASTLNS